MTERIRQIHEHRDFTYGRPRIYAELRDMGLQINRERVGRLMRVAGIQEISRRRSFVVTTHRDKGHRTWSLPRSALPYIHIIPNRSFITPIKVASTPVLPLESVAMKWA